MTIQAATPRRPSGIARAVTAAGGRAHLVRTALISLVLSVIAAVICALMAPGSHEVVTQIGDMPAWPQDEVRVAAEVWLTLAMCVVAVVTTVLWWRPWHSRPGASPMPHDVDPAAQSAVQAHAPAQTHAAQVDPVEAARGPVGVGIAVVAAIAQTGIGMLVWMPTVALRGFESAGAVGTDRIAAPVLSSTTAMWAAGLCAVLTYIVLTFAASNSDLRSQAAPRQQ
ncbi:hypothetical protein [Cumulibacter soli]|uniref:hypothetical protein n=1 Tax=Cumulibacter soli TaxID=2546344 RepID=UPI0010674D4B|nr:hypothetical protein [Cumulibacter soli]